MARLIEQGYSQAEIIERLRQRYPTEQPNVIYAAERRGREAYSAGVALSSYIGQGRVPLGDIPRAPVVGGGFRYYTTVQIPGAAGGPSLTRSVTVNSPANLTYGELLVQAALIVGETYGQHATRLGYELYTPEILEGSLVVTAIERA